MLNPTYLTLSRHQIFYFRWPLPDTFRQAGRTTHIKVSLRTREPKEALRLANILGYHANDLITQKGTAQMNYTEIKQMLEDYFRNVLQGSKKQMDEDGPYSSEDVERTKRLIARNEDPVAYAKFQKELGTVIPGKPYPQLSAVLDGAGVDIDRDSAAYARLNDLYRQGAIAYYHHMLAYSEEQSRFSFLPANISHAPSAQGEAQSTPSEPLSLIIEKFTEEMMTAGIWNPKAAMEREDCFVVLTGLLGKNIGFRSISMPEARTVKEALMRLPKNRNKMVQTRNLSLQEQIKLEGVDTLSVGSVNKYLQCYSSLFSWAVKNGYAEKNPFNGLALKEGNKKRRDQFSPEQVGEILADLANKKARKEIADYAYWGTLIGLYTGARLNEIASLTPNDIRQENGIWYFDINDQDEMKRLKTNAAARRVPIHSRLIELGFLDYLESVKRLENPSIRLLHELSYSEQSGWGRKLGRWFNTTFLNGLKIKKIGLSFHSLRHSAITSMRRAGVERPIVQALVGHEPDGVTEEVYTHGYDMVQLKAAIEKMHFVCAQ